MIPRKTTRDMSSTPITLAIYGDGFAAQTTAAACAAQLGQAARIVLIEPGRDPVDDLFYGDVSAPTAYDFFRTIGLDEQTLVSHSRTTFSYGTRFEDWPGVSKAWVQSYHLPLPVLSGVTLQHLLTARNEALDPYLVSSQAAQRGVFAHPPSDPGSPLSRAEYGYHFAVSDLTRLLRAFNANQPIKHMRGEIDQVAIQEGDISSLTLKDGSVVEADLYIDCSGAGGRLVRDVGAQFTSGRSLSAMQTFDPVDQIDGACRVIASDRQGWRSQTPLQGGIKSLKIRAASDPERDQSDEIVATLGHLDVAWRGNCVAIGHAAWMLEPLTPAPMMLLQRDVERLLELVPVSSDSAVEAREFNRRFIDDVAHVTAFHRAMFETSEMPSSRYWQEAIAEPVSQKLERKLTQFKNRGVFVRYDLEPFNEEDWAILYSGMGIRPQRYDRRADALDKAETERQLSGLKSAIAQLVGKMPPQHIYMVNLKRYLEKQKHG